jgi:hypothetical protein
MILKCVDGERKPVTVKPGVDMPLGRMFTYTSAESLKVSRKAGIMRTVTGSSKAIGELSVEKELYIRPAGESQWIALKPGTTRQARCPRNLPL